MARVASESTLAQASSWLTTASAALASRIAPSQILYGLAMVAWLADVGARRAWRAVRLPDFVYPMAVYALLSSVASAASLDPARSLTGLRELLILPAAILVANRFDRPRLVTALHLSVVASGLVLAAWGLAQYLTFSTDIRERIRGPLSHYMTYSGLLMLCTVAALARTVEGRRWVRVAAGAAAAFQGLVLLLTRTRGAYLGLAAALLALVALRRARLLLFAPVVLVGVLALVPPPVFHRMRSILDPANETNLSRVYLWKGGLAIIADYPFLGVGPHVVRAVYMGELPGRRGPDRPYRDARTPTRSDAHLHDNPLQVAAERGLPALAAWVAMFGLMAGRALRRRAAGAACTTAFLSLVAFHVAGIFEYNFGDSEVLLLTLVLAALPYAEGGAAPGGEAGE